MIKKQPTLRALLPFEEVDQEICTFINVRAPVETQCLYDVLDEVAGAADGPDFMALDVNGWVMAKAAYIDDINALAVVHECVAGWERIQQIMTAAQTDGIDLVFLFWGWDETYSLGPGAALEEHGTVTPTQRPDHLNHTPSDDIEF